MPAAARHEAGLDQPVGRRLQHRRAHRGRRRVRGDRHPVGRDVEAEAVAIR